MKSGIIASVLISLLLLGCEPKQQRQLKVTYLSDPPGGTLYRQNGELWGPCPKVLWYDLDDEALTAGQLQVKGLSVRWPGGPEERSADTIKFPIDRTDHEFTFVQPLGVASRTPGPRDRDTAAIANVTFEQDAGLREEPDDQIEPAKEMTKAAEPVGVAAEEKDYFVQAKPDQDAGLREEPDDQIEPTKEMAKAAEPVGVAAEEKDDSVQGKPDQDAGRSEEPDDQIEPTKEMAKAAEPVGVAAEEKDDSMQAKPDQDVGQSEKPDDQIEPTKEMAKAAEPVGVGAEEKEGSVQAKPDQDAGQSEKPDEKNIPPAGRSTVAGPEDPNAERQAQDDSDPDSPGDPPLDQASVAGPKVEPTPDLPQDPNDKGGKIEVRTRTVDFGNGVLIEFALIPAGEFIMGSGSDGNKRNPDRNPTQRVIISKPFYMSVYEVTQQQYEKVMGKNPSRFPGLQRPVETVSWEEARMFCKRLSDEGGAQYRLPTEAEWEYACRAGTTTAYYWGDSFDSLYAWTLEDREAQTQDVGAKERNAWGLYDMSGNVWEWCSDWYDELNFSSTALTDPQGPDGGTFRVLRGGSWGHSRANCRSGHRHWHTPNHRYDDCGFRIVMEIQPAPQAPQLP